MRIGLDVMGGDFAPQSTIQGAVLANQELANDDRIVLIGDKDTILSTLDQEGVSASDFDIEHASEVISMGEHPLQAFKKKTDSSISVGFNLLNSKKIDTFSSAGNSGAILIGSIYKLNAVPGIIRPCIAAVLPKENGGITILLDVGANPDPKPDVLYQFAILGSLYAQYVHNIKNPKIGLLNIGEEEEKGNLLSQSAHRMMKDTNEFNFIGNVEGRDFLNDKADVVVCDGFTGNVVLKQMESMYKLMLTRGLKDDFVKRFNYENYGGTPVLGINSSVVVGHGISSAKAIKNMILSSKNIYKANLSDKILNALKS